MEGLSPTDIAAIQARFRKFNSVGGSSDFTPPANTSPKIPPPKIPPPFPNAKTLEAIRAPVPIKTKTSIPYVDKVNSEPSAKPVTKIVAPQKVAAKAKAPPKPKPVDPLIQIRADIAAIPVELSIINKLRSFQLEHVQNLQYAIEHNTIAFDGSDTGTGKTYTGVALAKNRNLSLLVCCPKAVVPTWYKIADDMGVEALMVVNYETLKNGKYYASLGDYNNDIREECPYVTIHREVIVDDMTQEPVLTDKGVPKTKVTDIVWNFPDNCLVIFDEAHKGKNGLNAPIPTINSKLMMSTKRYFNKERSVFGLFLSATITDKLDNFDVTAYLLGLFKPYDKKTYKMFLRNLTSDNQGLLEAIHKKIFPRLGSRMNIKKIKESGHLAFKENIVRAMAYEMSAEDHDAIEAEHAKIKVALQQLRTRMLTDGPHPLVVILRARQKIEMIKVPLFVNNARKILFPGVDGPIEPLPSNSYPPEAPRSAMIFVCFNETIELITEKMIERGMSLEYIDYIRGGQSNEERAEIIRKFQNNEIHLLICNIQAGGVAISLQDLMGRQRVSFISPTWSSIELKQVLGRGYRADALSDMIQFVVYARRKKDDMAEQNVQTGVEEMMCAASNAKLHNIALLNDGDLQNYEDYTSAAFHINRD